ncbi:hypothetical protein N657DRAFT_690358 [Parathielavia appendiculata]|uniref:Septin-type G domain-containing protein n=1 Tax=Parathielavia appendiculata TaxID=2587402 RepID=A0AAN6TZJ6_9PEZI|nr:hypothetical protein N657DRAFT_690358 [Parathielavia appendiculata]
MRPAGDDAQGRPRSYDTDGPSTFRLPSAPQMTYSLGDESTIGSSSQAPPLLSRRVKDHRVPLPEHPEHPEHSKPRVPSHHDVERNKEPAPRPSSAKVPFDTLRHYDHDSSRPISPFPRPADTTNLSQPLTPVMLGASGPASALSSVSSRRNSLCLSDDLANCPMSMKDGDIAVEVEEEEQHPGEADPAGAESSLSMIDSGSAPQLIMPSIKMPSRRPFTDVGKRMGRLKVLVAGDSGVGKTSLIKAIVQSCEHIVHVDPITPSGLLISSVARSTQIMLPGTGRPQGSRRHSARESTGTREITEIYASTKPYPEWWSEVDDFRVLRRRKSLGDAVLDRNICFVDTPGYGSGSSPMETITSVAQYIEVHLRRIYSNHLSDGDLLNLLGGEGGVQVDAVFYMVSNRLRPVDIEYLQQLSPLTNIILLLAQTDLMSPEQITASKEQIHSQLKEANIRPFSFSTLSPSDADKQGIYAISSAAGSDHDTMDASLLMSPDYVQPLIPTELAALVAQVFTPNGAAWLRHSVARKYLAWRNANSPSSPALSSSTRPQSLARGQSLPQSLSLASSSCAAFPHSVQPCQRNFLPPLPPMQTPTSTGAGTSYALARLADHAQREERLAQVRLANWAAELQRSLEKEREEYARLARQERAIWLAERIGECVREGAASGAPGAVSGFDGPVVASDRDGCKGRGTGNGLLARSSRRRKRMGQRGGAGGFGEVEGETQHRHRQDPLGLLEVADELRHRGLIALEVLGSIGVLGGLALWVTRHYLHVQGLGWVMGEWERFWYGPR